MFSLNCATDSACFLKENGESLLSVSLMFSGHIIHHLRLQECVINLEQVTPYVSVLDKTTEFFAHHVSSDFYAVLVHVGDTEADFLE